MAARLPFREGRVFAIDYCIWLCAIRSSRARRTGCSSGSMCPTPSTSENRAPGITAAAALRPLGSPTVSCSAATIWVFTPAAARADTPSNAAINLNAFARVSGRTASTLSLAYCTAALSRSISLGVNHRWIAASLMASIPPLAMASAAAANGGYGTSRQHTMATELVRSGYRHGEVRHNLRAKRVADDVCATKVVRVQHAHQIVGQLVIAVRQFLFRRRPMTGKVVRDRTDLWQLTDQRVPGVSVERRAVKEDCIEHAERIGAQRGRQIGSRLHVTAAPRDSRSRVLRTGRRNGRKLRPHQSSLKEHHTCTVRPSPPAAPRRWWPSRWPLRRSRSCRRRRAGLAATSTWRPPPRARSPRSPTAPTGSSSATRRSPISAFTDRPERHTSTESLRSFVSGWKNNGFAADHPNAALVVDGAPAGHDTYTYEISKPRITRSGALVLSAKRLGARAPRHFGRASLFIDDSGVQTPITISATVGPGQSALLEFDDPIDIEPTDAFTPEFTATNGAFAELTDEGLVMSNGHSGQSSNVALAIDVDHVGTGPITGTANLLGAATASITVPGHAPVTIANGPFSVPVS